MWITTSVSKCFNYTLQSEVLNNMTINFILIPNSVCTEKIYNIYIRTRIIYAIDISQTFCYFNLPVKLGPVRRTNK